jgi:hypothetical protein
MFRVGGMRLFGSVAGLYRALVLQTLWNWFAVGPVGLRPISYSAMYGLLNAHRISLCGGSPKNCDERADRRRRVLSAMELLGRWLNGLGGDGIAFQRPGELDLLSGVSRDGLRFLVGDPEDVAVGHEHVSFRPLLDADCGAVRIRHLLAVVLIGLVLAIAVTIADGAFPCLFRLGGDRDNRERPDDD